MSLTPFVVPEFAPTTPFAVATAFAFAFHVRATFRATALKSHSVALLCAPFVVNAVLSPLVQVRPQLLGPDRGTWAWGRLHVSRLAHALSPLLSEDTRARLAVGHAPRGGSGDTVGNTAYLSGGLRVERNDALNGEDLISALPMLGGAWVQSVGAAEVKVRAAYGLGTRPLAPRPVVAARVTA